MGSQDEQIVPELEIEYLCRCYHALPSQILNEPLTLMRGLSAVDLHEAFVHYKRDHTSMTDSEWRLVGPLRRKVEQYLKQKQIDQLRAQGKLPPKPGSGTPSAQRKWGKP